MVKRMKSLFFLLMFFGFNTNSVLAAKVDLHGDCGNDKINTALGCVPIDFTAFMEWLLPIIFGVFGGIAFVLMVYGFVLLGTSSGDEKKVAGAKETITSAILGLVVSISALFILRLVAVDILQIPGI